MLVSIICSIVGYYLIGSVFGYKVVLGVFLLQVSNAAWKMHEEKYGKPF